MCGRRGARLGRHAGRIDQAMHDYRYRPLPLASDEITEAIAFLEWLASDNFTLLGMREYRYLGGDVAAAGPRRGHGPRHAVRPGRAGAAARPRGGDTTPEIRAFLQGPVPLIVTKANAKSRVHRRVYLDYIGVKLYTPEGRLIRRTAHRRAVHVDRLHEHDDRRSPISAPRSAQVIAKRASTRDYSGKALLNVLENYPRDELFQVDVDTLLTFADRRAQPLRAAARARPCAHRQVRPLRLGARLHPEGPLRHECAPEGRRGPGEAVRGPLSAAYPAYPEGPLARTHYIIGRDGGTTPDVTARSAGSGGQRRRAHLARRAPRCAAARRPIQAAHGCWRRAMPGRSRAPTARRSPQPTRSPISPCSSGSTTIIRAPCASDAAMATRRAGWR